MFITGTANSGGEELSVWAGAGGREALKRLFGCILLFAMPDPAIEEAIDSLRDISDFYLQSPQLELTYLPASSERHIARLRSVVTRPDMAIEE